MFSFNLFRMGFSSKFFYFSFFWRKADVKYIYFSAIFYDPINSLIFDESRLVDRSKWNGICELENEIFFGCLCGNVIFDFLLFLGMLKVKETFSSAGFE